MACLDALTPPGCSCWNAAGPCCCDLQGGSNGRDLCATELVFFSPRQLEHGHKMPLQHMRLASACQAFRA